MRRPPSAALGALFAVFAVAALTGGGAQAAFTSVNGKLASVSAAAPAGFFFFPDGVISGAINERFGPELVSFRHESGGAVTWTESDSVIESDASAQADQTYTTTSDTLDASGGASARRGVEAREVVASSSFVQRFELQEPMQFTATGSLSASEQVPGGGIGFLAQASARLIPGDGPTVFRVEASSSGPVSQAVIASGTLQPGDYTLLVNANASGGKGARPAASTVGSAAFQVRLVLSPPPPPPTGPIGVTGGPEASNLNLQVDNANPGVRYTFGDVAPLQVSDPRCQSGPPITCQVPAAVPVEIDLGDGDDVMTLSGSFPFGQLTVSGGGGDDTLIAAPIARGGPGSDAITAGNCGGVQCVLDGGEDDDSLTGGPGDDLLLPGEDADPVVRGEGGSDTVDYSNASNDVDVFLDTQHVDEDGGLFVDQLDSIENAIGSAHADLLVGDAGPNRLEGGPGDDGLDGRGGPDELLGGADRDQVIYVLHPAFVEVTLNDGLANDGEPGEGDRVEETEDAIGSPFGDTLVGTDGPNVLEGGGGDDTIRPGAGSDRADGGAGSDTADYSDAPARVVVELFADSADEAAGTTDALPDVENAIGSAFDDAITGDDDPAVPNRLEGRGGNDFLWGVQGPDELIGGPGIDSTTYLTNTTGVFVNLSNDLADDGSPGEGDRVVEIENVVGTEDDDVIDGNDDANRLQGLAGNDALFGEGGDDVLLGDDGDDLVGGGSGDDEIDGGLDADVLNGDLDEDTVVYRGRTQGVFVDLRNTTVGGEGEPGERDDVDSDFENVVGGAGNDVVIGNASDNTLEGSDGNDGLEGLGGSDVLDGGFGDDFLSSRDGVSDDVLCGPGLNDEAFADPLDNTRDCETVTLPPPPPPPGNTPAGTNVIVTPVDATTLTFPLTVTFANVTVPGQTLLFTSQTGPIVPAGFQLGSPPVYYFISTTAGFTPPITTCIDTTGITFPGGVPRFFHFEFGVWVDRTTSVGPGAQVCGVTSTLSPFAVFAADFRSQLLELRGQVAGLEPSLTGRQAKLRLRTVLDFLDRALLPGSWKADGSLVVAPRGIFALRQIRTAVNHLRTPNVELNVASAALQRALVELVRTMAEARYAEAAAAPGASAAAVANARSHLDLAAAQPGSPTALEESIKAWDNLDKQPPQ